MLLLRHDLMPRPVRRPEPLEHISPAAFLNMPDGSVRPRTWHNERAAGEMALQMDREYNEKTENYAKQQYEEEFFRYGKIKK